MDMADIRNAGKREEMRVEEPLHGGLRGSLVDTALKEQVLHIGVGPCSLKKREEGPESAEGQALLSERSETVTACLDQKGLLIDAGRGVPLTKDRHAAFFAAEVMAESD
jgi:hypothetical protein